jgi:hypothetical protein
MGDAAVSFHPYSWHVINNTRWGIMKVAKNEVLVLVAASVFGMLLAMTSPHGIAFDNGPSAEVVGVSPVNADFGTELVSSVDWSKIKQEPMSPTF